VVYSAQPNWPGFTAKCGEDAHSYRSSTGIFLSLRGVHMREVDGTVEDDFEAVRDAFAEVQSKDEGGAQLCIYHRGKRVVDLWTGRCLIGEGHDHDVFWGNALLREKVDNALYQGKRLPRARPCDDEQGPF
jgi:hypothetical protein